MDKKSRLASAIAVAVTLSGTAFADNKGGFVFKPPAAFSFVAN